MSIDANYKSVHDFLDISVGQIIIPDFQRKYSWEREHLEKLWEDILNIDESQTYFIGSIIYYTESNNRFITDGQQRLTTLFILLSSIRDLLNSYSGGEGAASDIDDYFKAKIDDDGLKANKLVSENAEEYASKFLGSLISFESNEPYSFHEKWTAEKINLHSDELKRIYEARIFFDIQLKKYVEKYEIQEEQLQNVKKIFKKVKRLGIVDIKLDTKNEAFRIFNTLNARGLNLNSSDLIKNHIYSLLGPQEQVKFIESWEIIDRNINDINRKNNSIDLDLFLYHEWFSLGNKVTVRKSSIHEEYEKIVNKGNVEEYIDRLKKDSIIYRFIFAPEYDKNNEDSSYLFKEIRRMKQFRYELEFYNLMNINRSASAILSLIRFSLEGEGVKFNKILDVMKLINNFHFQFDAVSGYKDWEIKKTTFHNFAKDLYNKPENFETVVLDMKRSMSRGLLTEDKFKSNIVRVNYLSNPQLCRYVLDRFDRFKEYSRPTVGNFGTIEHLKPRKDGGLFTHYLGNLLIMSADLNEELGDKNPIDKINILKRKNFTLPEKMEKAIKWNEGEIIQNTEDIAMDMYKHVFNLDFE